MKILIYAASSWRDKHDIKEYPDIQSAINDIRSGNYDIRYLCDDNVSFLDLDKDKIIPTEFVVKFPSEDDNWDYDVELQIYDYYIE